MIVRPRLVWLFIWPAIFLLFEVAAISYRCENHQVLVVQSFGNDTIRMHCQKLGLCGYEGLTCNYEREQPSCGGKKNFVAHVNQITPTGPVAHTCCELATNGPESVPGHDANDCFVYELPDGTPPTDEELRKFTQSSIESENDQFTLLKNAQQVPQEFDGYVGYRMRLFMLKNKAPPMLIVKAIERLPEGYRVTICRPRCGKFSREEKVKHDERTEITGDVEKSLKPDEWAAAAWSKWSESKLHNVTITKWSNWTRARSSEKHHIVEGDQGAFVPETITENGQSIQRSESLPSNSNQAPIFNINVVATGGAGGQGGAGGTNVAIAQAGGGNGSALGLGTGNGASVSAFGVGGKGANGTDGDGVGMKMKIHMGDGNGVNGDDEVLLGGPEKGKGGRDGNGDNGSDDGDQDEAGKNSKPNSRGKVHGGDGNGLDGGDGDDSDGNGNGLDRLNNSGNLKNNGKGKGLGSKHGAGLGDSIGDDNNGSDGDNNPNAGQDGPDLSNGGKGNGNRNDNDLGDGIGRSLMAKGGNDKTLTGDGTGKNKNKNAGVHGGEDDSEASGTVHINVNKPGDGSDSDNSNITNDAHGKPKKGGRYEIHGDALTNEFMKVPMESDEHHKKHSKEKGLKDGQHKTPNGVGDADGDGGEAAEDVGDGGLGNGGNKGDGGRGKGNGDDNGGLGGNGLGDGGGAGLGSRAKEPNRPGSGLGRDSAERLLNGTSAEANGTIAGLGGAGHAGSGGADLNSEEIVGPHKVDETNRVRSGHQNGQNLGAARVTVGTQRPAPSGPAPTQPPARVNLPVQPPHVPVQQPRPDPPPHHPLPPPVQHPSPPRTVPATNLRVPAHRPPTHGVNTVHQMPPEAEEDNGNVWNKPAFTQEANSGEGVDAGANGGSQNPGGGNGGGGNGPSHSPPVQNDMLANLMRMNCFPANTLVRTASGYKSMEELEVGDMVLVPASGHSLKYERVEMFYHRDPEKIVRFLTMYTQSGRNISLTELHLLPFGDCMDIQRNNLDIEGIQELVSKSKFAHKAKIGDCVLSINEQGKIFADRITKIGRKVSKGIYSPMTVEGTIIANDILASCFSQIESHSIQKLAYDILIGFYNVFGYMQSSTHENLQRNIPSMLSYVHKLSAFILPFAKY